MCSIQIFDVLFFPNTLFSIRKFHIRESKKHDFHSDVIAQPDGTNPAQKPEPLSASYSKWTKLTANRSPRTFARHPSKTKCPPADGTAEKFDRQGTMAGQTRNCVHLILSTMHIYAYIHIHAHSYCIQIHVRLCIPKNVPGKRPTAAAAMAQQNNNNNENKIHWLKRTSK